jgi:4'-phosphopantetheinyl transferase
MSRLRRPEDRTRFACATILARRAVAMETDSDPHTVVIDRRCATCGAEHGKPTTPGLLLSIAHAGDVVGVAITRDGDVGLDVEPTTDKDLRRLGRDVLGAGETARSSTDLLRYWTRKEALVKATGDGIVVGLARVVVTSPSEPPELVAYPGRPDLRARMADLRCRAGYVASIAMLTSARVRFTEQWHDPA